MKDPQLRLLLVADDEADYSAIRSIPLLETVAYNEPSLALETGAEEEFDALLLDGEWVDCGVVQQVAQANPRLPILLIARSETHEERALASLNRGADDYLMQSELTSVSICSALRNARKLRRMRHERDNALRQLAESGTGVPIHFNERLRTSLNVIEAFADTMDRQLDGHPAAAMGGAILDELESLQQLVADVADNRRAAEGNLVVYRQPKPIGQLVQRILARPSQQNLSVEYGDWDAHAICDHEKTIRAISRIVEYVQAMTPDAELTLTVDDEQGRIALQLSGDTLTAEACETLTSTPRIAAGEAGFERVVAVRLLDAQQIYLDAEPTAVWFDFPTSTQQLAQRWSHWMCQGDWADVTLFEVEATAEAECEWAEDYLHRGLHARDFVCPAGPNQWLIALSGHAREAEMRMRQLTKTWQIIDSSTELRSELISSYRLPLQQETLERQLLAALGNSRRVLLLDKSPMPVSPINRRLVEAGFDVVSVEQPDALHAAVDASAIVGDAESLEALEELRGTVCPPNIPVFLVGNLKDQQRALQNNVRLLNENSDNCIEDLIDALEQSAPAPYGRRATNPLQKTESENDR